MNAIQEAREASLRLVRLLGSNPEDVVPRRPLLENAIRDARANDLAEDYRLKMEEAPYWEANRHDAEYWRKELAGKVSEGTIHELLHSMGLE